MMKMTVTLMVLVMMMVMTVFLRPPGALLDILQRTGVKGYTAFLESLELDYPQLYTRITGKEPNKTFSILIGGFRSGTDRSRSGISGSWSEHGLCLTPIPLVSRYSR